MVVVVVVLVVLVVVGREGEGHCFASCCTLPLTGPLQLESDTSDVCQLTLVRLTAVVGEIVGAAVNQTQLASETGRAARQSWHFLANVRVPDSEGAARLLRGTAGMA